jgi:hypothetical protein
MDGLFTMDHPIYHTLWMEYYGWYGCDYLPFACSTQTVAHNGIRLLDTLTCGQWLICQCVDRGRPSLSNGPSSTVYIERNIIGNCELILHGFYRLHGLPRAMVTNCDSNFFSSLWPTLSRRLGTRLNMSFSRYPETDGLIEHVNIAFQQLSCCFCLYDGSN